MYILKKVGEKMLEIYTDGSAHPNPGPGGFGVVVLDKDKNKCHNNYTLVKLYNKQFDKTTNNEQELKAILYAFFNYGIIPNDGFDTNIPIVYSDSAYAVNTFNDWMFKWANNNWRKSDKSVPENLELIQAYYNWYQKGYRINLQKIKGHAGNQWNELADKLARNKLSTEETQWMKIMNMFM